MTTKDSFPISFDHFSRHFTGIVTPVPKDTDTTDTPQHFMVDLVDYGTFHLHLTHIGGTWASPDMQNHAFITDIGHHIDAWYKMMQQA